MEKLLSTTVDMKMFRMLDIVLVVVGALLPLLPGAGFDREAAVIDGMLVAFAAAFAMTVFPRCKLYATGRMRAAARIVGWPMFAWGIVQVGCLALLSALQRAQLISAFWFVCWTLATAVGLVLFRAVAVAAVVAMRREWSRLIAASTGEGQGTARRSSGFVKRGFDLVVASLLLVLFAPCFVVIAVAVKCDGGPVFFGHERVGRRGQRFRCWKFRSMVPNADQVLQKLLAGDPQARAEWDREFKLKRDVRVTAVGVFLRRSSLDELPQLFNVIAGQMSLVGPRPIVSAELSRYGERVNDYLALRPGVTGLWQVSGRNDTGYATRVRLDMAYVRSRSMRTDLLILMKTFKVVLRGSGAY
ncbi:sugar transferase [Burkholderia sp. A1]|uniref:sugar transferase n=1 Tax=Burkholderia sp. A1 TaxID=148446 RepID=UPI001376A807|nr:sugar transferase [Burkholderia sp. A1]